MKKRITPEQFFKIARSLPRDERTPYAFEKRVMARLAAEGREIDAISLWARALWRAVTPCLGVMAAVCLLAVSFPDDPPEAEDLDLDAAVMAPAQFGIDFGA